MEYSLVMLEYKLMYTGISSYFATFSEIVSFLKELVSDTANSMGRIIVAMVIVFIFISLD